MKHYSDIWDIDLSIDQSIRKVLAMGQIKLPPKIRLICAVCYSNEQVLSQATETLVQKFGTIEQSSESLAFTYTDYYSAEMGAGLKKVFHSFATLMDPASIIDIKLATNDIEQLLSSAGRRTVNLDPGYLEAAKLVLATTKNFSHRIYLGKGIYGDVQLYFRKGRFQTNEWTYPDYKDKKSLAFFTKIRNEYLAILSESENK